MSAFAWLLDALYYQFPEKWDKKVKSIKIKQSQVNVVNRIGADPKLFGSAMVNLKSELEGLIVALGYEKVEFEII